MIRPCSGMRLLMLHIVLCCLCGCNRAPDKYKMTNAELGLTPQQAQGRRLFNARCLQCHEAYGSQKRVSVSLEGIFRKPFLPSGIPAHDERVREIIARGKRMMPATALDDTQLQALLDYLHTL